MKKLFALIAVIAMFLAVGNLAIADDEDTTHWYQETYGANWDNSYIPDCIFGHTHDIYLDQRRNPMGAGADVVLFQSQNALLEEVTAEYRYDINNDEHSVFGVVRVNAWKGITNLFQ